MKRNAKLTFVKRDDRPTLSPEDIRYWKDILRRVLKVGFEFEMNLPENRGNCPGDSLVCPCSHPEKETRQCYKKCVLLPSCKLKEKYGCADVHCVEFVSPCQTCTEIVRDCTLCELFDNPEKRPSKIRERLTCQLKPTNDLSTVGEVGTMSVINDGSLLGDGGVEVTTVGRRVNFDAFYNQAKTIIDNCKKEGAYLNERTSIHMHLIAGYFYLAVQGGKMKVVYSKDKQAQLNQISELEKPVPEIILANFQQLIRRYHNALTWITSAGDSYNHLTRWVKFRMPVLKFAAVRTGMPKILQQIAEQDGHGGKYSFINYSFMMFKEGTDDIDRFHLEGRFVDGMHVPSAVAAFGILLYSLLIKAISLSQYGVMQSGDNEYMDKAYKIQNALLNNSGNWGGPRTSDTSGFEPFREAVRNQTQEMLDMVHSELKYHGPAEGILRKLADNPVSMMRCAGASWDDIESTLYSPVGAISEVEHKIMEAVDTFYLNDCVSQDEWENVFGEDAGLNKELVTNATKSLVARNLIVWDNVAGSFMRC